MTEYRMKVTTASGKAFFSKPVEFDDSDRGAAEDELLDLMRGDTFGFLTEGPNYRYVTFKTANLDTLELERVRGY